MKKPQTPEEQEAEYKAISVTLFCILVLMTFFIIGYFTYLYVIIGLILSILIYTWYFLFLPLRRRRKP